MQTKLHKYRSLLRCFSLRCLLIHPLIGKRNASLLDIKSAEEAVGLVNALDYAVATPLQKAEVYDQSKPSSIE